ncbi:MAG: BamA/TamA family outer membrane protein [Acidobacteria bacterium]|nr:BamA/TamA family outer membrane protein [Acidobacteriota bacterium]
MAPHITIQEGVRTVVGEVGIQGNTAVTEGELRPVVNARPGEAYFEPQIIADREAVLVEYLNRGYQDAQVRVQPRFSPDRTSADLTFSIQEGPQTIVDHILIVGNTRTSETTIRRELQLEPGRPLGLAALNESQRRLSGLGLFRLVRISVLTHGGAGARRDVLVAVEEALPTSIGYGGGLEARQRTRTGAQGIAEERLEFAPRGFFEIGRRNLWGKNRAVNLFSRISLRPKDAPNDPDEDGRGYGFSEYRLIGTYREPKALTWNADAVFTVFLEQAIRTSFNFNRKGITGELRRQLTPTVHAGARYELQQTKTFDERLDPEEELLIDRLFPEIRLSAFTATFARDTRDDAIDPARGAFVSVEGKLAARGVGSEVGFGRSFAQVFVFHRLPGERRVVLAGGARLGLATGFPREVAQTGPASEPVLGPDGQPDVTTVRDLPASERFFAGGDTTVRGFAFDQLGAPDTISQNEFPIGGNALVVLNAELRVLVWRDVGAVGFFDSGNVFARTEDLDFAALRSSAGFGLRYRSPIGPLRLDLGFKLSPRELSPGRRERLTALHVSIGQAF